MDRETRDASGKETKLSAALRFQLLERRSRNPHYSLRAFARSLAISPSAICEILKGKRSVSKERGKQLIERLSLMPEDARAILAELSAKNDSSSSLSYVQLSDDDYHIIAQWHHFAILSLTKTKGFRSDPKWIAGRLGITQKTADSAIRRLVKLNLLKKNANGKLVRSHERFTTSDETTNLALRAAHRTNLELATKALDEAPMSSRDFRAITMAIDPKALPKAKREIRKFTDKVSQTLETGQKTAVFKLCVQLFPLTQGEIYEH
jgi:uncharacterized protein (TIGR02147 family)